MSAISTSVHRVTDRLGSDLTRRSAGTPAVTLIVAVYDPPIEALRSQLAAIATQTSSDWECVVVDDASTDPAVVEFVTAWCAADTNRVSITRPVNGGIAAATNDGIEHASGQILAICDHDDIVHAGAVDALIRHFDEHPDHDVVYTDEQLIDEDGAVIAEYRKPEYSPYRHLGHHYLAHLVAARRTAIGDLRVDQRYEPAQDYDFYLRVIERATAAGRRVGHIADVLYSWRAIAGSSALDAAEKPEMTSAVLRCSRDAVARRRLGAATSTVLHGGIETTSVRLAFDHGPASAIDTIRFERSDDPDDIAALVGDAASDVVCLVANDVDIDPDDIATLVGDALRPDIGVVGPMVIGDDGSEPVRLSVGRTVSPTLSDPFHGTLADSTGPWGAFFVSREVSALAPVVLVVERSKYDSVGGLRSGVSLDVSVAELCVRLADSGASTIIDPAATARVASSEPLLDPDPVERRRVDDQLAVIEHRGAPIRSERYATTGIPPATDVEPDAYERARRLIVGGAARLVTSDVFDTIVTRPVTTPSDLFVELAARLHDAGILRADVTPMAFADGRREAERRARHAHASLERARLRAQGLSDADVADAPGVAAPECTLAEIWSFMPARWIDPNQQRAGLELELTLEGERLAPIPAAIEVFRLARERDIDVVLVSDIYLSAAELTEVLASAGVDMDLVSDVVTSADHRLGKADGLLGRVIEQRSVPATAVMHLGDNEIADVQTAVGLGAHPIHVEVPTVNAHVPVPGTAVRAWSRANGTDLGISAAIRTTLVGAGSLGLDPSYQFGAATVGPVLAGFSRWVSVTAQRLGATSVHCMLREGATIADLMGLTAPDGPAPVPLHVSRWVTMRAAVIDATPDDLLTALARRADLTVDHVVDAFGADPALVRDALGTERVAPGALVEACEAMADHAELRAQIVASAAHLRDRVLMYLGATLQLDDGPLVVADVGWGGTIQEGLERILAAGGVDREVVGLYLAMSAAGEQRARRGADMRAYLPNRATHPEAARHGEAVAHHADTIERIMTPETGTLIDISPTGEPITRDATHDRLPPTLRAAQRAMRAAVATLAAPENPLSDMTDGRWVDDLELRTAFSATLAAAVTNPTEPLAAALGAWPHDDVAGTGHRSIAGGDLAAAVTFGNARDLDLIDPAGRNWAAGLAAQHNPALAAQLHASLADVSLAGLCPESDNGVARLAAFEVGSDMAAVQIGRAPAVSPNGWSMLRIAGPVDSLRSIRFDAGEYDAIVDVGHLSITLTTDRLVDPVPRHVDDLTAPDLVWVASHPIDTRHFGQRAGGHLIIPIDADLAPHVREVEATVAFRSWVLDDDDTLATTPVVQRIGSQGRRVVGGVKRRLQR